MHTPAQSFTRPASRRSFLRRSGGLCAGAAAMLAPDAAIRAAQAVTAAGGRAAEEVAPDEDFWREIQLGFW